MDEGYCVKVTDYAQREISGIGRYIRDELLAPEAAVNTVRAIWDEISTLEFMPARIHLTPEEPWHSEGIRRMAVKNFYVYFWIDKKIRTVWVIDATYVRRDQRKQLEQIPE